MIEDQMQFMILAGLLCVFSLWVCLCDTPKKGILPMILLLITVILTQLVGRV